MRRTTLAALLLAAGASAQPTAAPTPETAGPSLGRNAGGYNIVNSFETGYRFRSVNGDLGKYRSDVNFGNGLRLLSGAFSVHSREGHGRFFDEMVVRAHGLGHDPYQFSSLRLQHNRLYRYDLTWRQDEYFNPALPIAGGLHAIDTARRLQDHDLTLLPQSRLKLFVGYTRNSQDGPALTTVQGFDPHGNVFPVFSNVRRLRNEYRLGSELRLYGFVFHWVRGWDNFSETSRDSLPVASAGIIATDAATLGRFQRSQPYGGSSPYWRTNLHTDRKHFAAHARFTYAAGRRSFFFDETAAGTARFGAANNRQLLVAGSARRPVSAGSLSLTAFPNGKLTLSNHTSFHHTRMDGDSSFRELSNASFEFQFADFQFLGIRAISNLTDATFRASRWLGLYGGYHYSTRRIRSLEAQEIAGSRASLSAEQTNVLHDGLLGLRLQPVKPLTLNFDATIGRADRPIYPIGARRYHALGARAQYKKRSVLLSAAARSDYNNNSVSLSAHSSRSRSYSLDASWTPRDWFAFDAGYSKLHLDTLSGIAYFTAGRFDPNLGHSVYVSNLHAGHLTARFSLGPRASLYIGYTRVQDVGTPTRAGNVIPAARLDAATIAAGAFVAAQTFPLAFESPLARFSLRLHGNLRWNAGYQFYRYREDFLSRQNYRAHTGYTSVLWSF